MNKAHRLISIVLPLIIFSVLFVQKTYASGIISLSASSTYVPTGKIVYVTVRSNTSDLVNAVQANLSYPSDKLQFLSISSGSSPFSIAAGSSGGGGSVQIARGVIGQGLSGSQFIATVSFKALASNGTADVSVAGGSSLVRSSDQANVMSSSSGVNINFTTPAPSSPDDSSTKSSAVVTGTPTPEKINIDNIQAHTSTFSAVTITWDTNASASSIVNYGLDDKYGLTAGQDDKIQHHSVFIQSPVFIPGLTYHYQVKSTTLDGGSAESSDQTFTIPGYTVNITLTDASGNILPNTTVVLQTENGILSAITNEQGVAIFTDVTAGQHVLTTNQSSGATVQTINVRNTHSTAPQTVKVLVAGSSAHTYINYFEAGAVIVLLLLSILFLSLKSGWTRRRLHNRDLQIYSKSTMNEQSVSTDEQTNSSNISMISESIPDNNISEETSEKHT